jgi:FkbM family methyltransferase
MRPFKTLPGALYRALGHYPTRLRGKRLRVDPNHWRFWRKAARGRWEPETLTILESELGPDMVFCDIGAWIGPITLLAARHCRRVYCFEPDTTAYAELLNNLRLNRVENATTFNIALCASEGLRTLASFGRMPGDSRTSLLAAPDDASRVQALCLSWNHWLQLAKPERVDFLKVDIEGGEFELLPDMAAYLAAQRPRLLLSTHAPYLAASERVAAMDALLGALATYRNCFDERRRPLRLETLREPNATDRFRTFYFRD